MSPRIMTSIIKYETKKEDMLTQHNFSKLKILISIQNASTMICLYKYILLTLPVASHSKQYFQCLKYFTNMKFRINLFPVIIYIKQNLGCNLQSSRLFVLFFHTFICQSLGLYGVVIRSFLYFYPSIRDTWSDFPLAWIQDHY